MDIGKAIESLQKQLDELKAKQSVRGAKTLQFVRWHNDNGRGFAKVSFNDGIGIVKFVNDADAKAFAENLDSLIRDAVNESGGMIVKPRKKEQVNHVDEV